MFLRILLSVLILSGLALAEPEEFPVKGYSIRLNVVLPVPPDTAFGLMTGDISGWWDHHFSEYSKHLYIEPRPGGGFYEIFDNAAHGVRHAVVTWAEPGKHLRFEGPLGLAGSAITMVTTWDYEPVGDRTLLNCTVNLSGQINVESARKVEGVWHHFLIEQLKPWAEKRDKK
jgi:hypothetical protein